MQNQPTSPEIRLQVAYSLPSSLHVSTHPNPGYYTEYRELFKIFLLQGVVFNKNTNNKFDLFVDVASFQSKTAKLQVFEFCRLSSMGLGGFCGFFSEKKPLLWLSFNQDLSTVHIQTRIHFIL